MLVHRIKYFALQLMVAMPLLALQGTSIAYAEQISEPRADLLQKAIDTQLTGRMPGAKLVAPSCDPDTNPGDDLAISTSTQEDGFFPSRSCVNQGTTGITRDNFKVKITVNPLNPIVQEKWAVTIPGPLALPCDVDADGLPDVCPTVPCERDGDPLTTESCTNPDPTLRLGTFYDAAGNIISGATQATITHIDEGQPVSYLGSSVYTKPGVHAKYGPAGAIMYTPPTLTNTSPPQQNPPPPGGWPPQTYAVSCNDYAAGDVITLPPVGQEFRDKDCNPVTNCSGAVIRTGDDIYSIGPNGCAPIVVPGQVVTSVRDIVASQLIDQSLFVKRFENDYSDAAKRRILALSPSEQSVWLEPYTPVTIPEVTRVSFEMVYEGNYACVYAYSQDPGIVWRVEKGEANAATDNYPGTMEEVLDLKFIPKEPFIGVSQGKADLDAANAALAVDPTNPDLLAARDAICNGCADSSDATVMASSGALSTSMKNLGAVMPYAAVTKMHCFQAPPPPAEKNVLKFNQFISKVCTEYDTSSSRWPRPFTGVMMECIEDTMMNIFIAPSQVTAGGVELTLADGTTVTQTETFFTKTQNRLKGIVRTILAIYIMIFGIRLIYSAKGLERGEWMWFGMKLALVIYFALGTGMVDVFPGALRLEKGLAAIVMQAGLGPLDAALVSAQTDAAKANQDVADARKLLAEMNAIKAKAQSDEAGANQSVVNAQAALSAAQALLPGAVAIRDADQLIVNTRLGEYNTVLATVQTQLDNYTNNIRAAATAVQTAANALNTAAGAFKTAADTRLSDVNALILERTTLTNTTIPNLIGDLDLLNGQLGPTNWTTATPSLTVPGSLNSTNSTVALGAITTIPGVTYTLTYTENPDTTLTGTGNEYTISGLPGGGTITEGCTDVPATCTSPVTRTITFTAISNTTNLNFTVIDGAATGGPAISGFSVAQTTDDPQIVLDRDAICSGCTMAGSDVTETTSTGSLPDDLARLAVLNGMSLDAQKTALETFINGSLADFFNNPDTSFDDIDSFMADALTDTTSVYNRLWNADLGAEVCPLMAGSFASCTTTPPDATTTILARENTLLNDLNTLITQGAASPLLISSSPVTYNTAAAQTALTTSAAHVTTDANYLCLAGGKCFGGVQGIADGLYMPGSPLQSKDQQLQLAQAALVLSQGEVDRIDGPTGLIATAQAALTTAQNAPTATPNYMQIDADIDAADTALNDPATGAIAVFEAKNAFVQNWYTLNPAVASTGDPGVAGTGYSYCDFRLMTYPEGKEYMVLWDTVDCKISKYLGIGDTRIKKVGGQIAPSPSVPNSIWVGLTAVISVAFGIPILIFTIIVLAFIMIVVVRVVHIYIMAFISAVLLVYISPIVIPAVLFKATNKIYANWMRQLTGNLLQPVILFAFLSFMFATMDEVVFGGNHVFVSAPDAPVPYLIANKDGSGKAAIDTDDCEDPKAIACIYQTTVANEQDVALGGLAFGDMHIYTIPLQNKEFDLFIGLLKLLLICFIVQVLLGSVVSLSSRLTAMMSIEQGAGKLAIFSGGTPGPAAIMGAMRKITGAAIKAPGNAYQSVKRAGLRVEKAGKGAVEAGKKMKQGREDKKAAHVTNKATKAHQDMVAQANKGDAARHATEKSDKLSTSAAGALARSEERKARENSPNPKPETEQAKDAFKAGTPPKSISQESITAARKGIQDKNKNDPKE